MRRNLLSYVGGLGLVAGALLWPNVSQAQGFCYLINSEGEVVNLDDICQSNDSSASPTPQGGAAVETQDASSASEVRTTITRPTGTTPAVTSPGTAGADQNSPQADPATDGAEASPTGEESPSETPAETSAETNSDTNDAVDTGPENRLDIPVREIQTPQIPEIRTPQRVNSTGESTDTSR